MTVSSELYKLQHKHYKFPEHLASAYPFKGSWALDKADVRIFWIQVLGWSQRSHYEIISGLNFWKSPVKITLKAAHGQKSMMCPVSSYLSRKKISQPHTPYSSSPNRKSTNTKDYLPWAKEHLRNCTDVTSFNPHYTPVGLQLLSLLYKWQNWDPEGLHNLLNIKQIVNGKVITRDHLTHAHIAKFSSAITLLEAVQGLQPSVWVHSPPFVPLQLMLKGATVWGSTVIWDSNLTILTSRLRVGE